MRLRLTWPSMVAVLLAGLPLSQPSIARAFMADIEEACLAELKKSGPPSWQQAASFVKVVSVTCQERRTDDTFDGSKPITNKISADWSLSWDQKASTRLLERRDVDLGGVTVRGVNPKYRFVVSKLNEKDPFRLETGKRFVLGSPQTYDASEEQFRLRMESGFRIQAISLEELLAGKEFRLTSVKYVADSQSPEKPIRIESQYLGSEGRSRHAGGIYWAEVDPAQSWLIRRSGVRTPATGQEWSQEITYQETDSHILFPAMLKVSMNIPRAKLKSLSVYTFGKPTIEQPGRDQFYLTHYKIPETALGYAGASIWPRIILVSGGVFGLAGLCAITWYRRKIGEKPSNVTA